MTDISTLLNDVAPEIPAPSAAVIEADLARGRAAIQRARQRRTARRAAVGATSLAAVAAIGVLIADSSGTTRAGRQAQLTSPAVRHGAPPRHQTAQVKVKSGVAQVRLVAYTGAQLPGFTVAQVPSGWHLSTSTPYALLITRDGSTNNDPDVFVGKLAVLTSSVDEHGLGSGDAVTVNGEPGRVSTQDDVQVLRYNSANGFGVDIQAPTALGWSDANIVAFAEGITVTAHAIHSEG